MSPSELFQLLSQPIRLHAVLLIRRHTELCVCELVDALGESQPKISRHLAPLRTAGVLSAERRGHWVYYRLGAALPGWAMSILDAAAQAEAVSLNRLFRRLTDHGRPGNCEDTPKPIAGG